LELNRSVNIVNMDMLEDYNSLGEESLPNLFHCSNGNDLSYSADSFVELPSSSIKSSSISLKDISSSYSNKIDD